MFESSDFLDLYLPDYFQKAYQRTYSARKQQQESKSYLEFIASFIKFPYQLYYRHSLEKQFSQLIEKQFLIPNDAKNSGTQKQLQTPTPEKKRIIEFIEPKINTVEALFIELYLKIIKMQSQIKQQQIQPAELEGYSKICCGL